ncbi:MAG: hypothetical protein PUE01_03590 [Clostridiaceae bacterium]|nr:hypothetical protein [Clostridiaceae bacterium]
MHLNWFGYKRKEQTKSPEEKALEDEKIQRLKDEHLGFKDAIALIIALFQVVLPILFGMIAIYAIVIYILTTFWLK